MKYIYLIIILLTVSCNANNAPAEVEEQEFIRITQTWHHKYMQGGENLEDILSALDKDIDMWENGKVWTYQELEKFGPHLPKKSVIETYNDQELLGADLGYDYVSQLYISSLSGDTLRETSSRLWKKENGSWKIVRMNNLIKKESD